MKSYLLYLPSSVRSLDDVPAAAGLLRDDDEGVLWQPQTVTGPDGKQGRIGHWNHPGREELIPHLICDMTAQTWLQVAGSDLWIGWRKTEQLKPAALVRKKTYSGYELPLADGNEWVVLSGMMLPQRYAFTGEQPALQTKPEYQSIYERTMWAFEFCKSRLEFDDPIPPERAIDVMKYVGEILSFNYRLNWQVAVTLGLFQPGSDGGASLWQMLLATTDMKRLDELIRELETKKAQPTGFGLGTASGSDV